MKRRLLATTSSLDRCAPDSRDNEHLRNQSDRPGVMITRFCDDPLPANWPWWTLVEAVIWIVGEEDPGEPNDAFGGDLDWSARNSAARDLRTALAEGRVTAYGLGSHSDKPKRIEPVEWNSRDVPISDFPGLKSWQYEPYRSVVVAKDEIKRGLVQLASDEKVLHGRRGRGRRKGSGSFQKADAPFVAEMHRLITAGEAVSANEAANMVLVGEINGSSVRGQSDDAKRDRLRRRYKAQFGGSI